MNGLRGLVVLGQQSCRLAAAPLGGRRSFASGLRLMAAEDVVPRVNVHETVLKKKTKSDAELEHDRGMQGTIEVVGPADVGSVSGVPEEHINALREDFPACQECHAVWNGWRAQVEDRIRQPGALGEQSNGLGLQRRPLVQHAGGVRLQRGGRGVCREERVGLLG